MTTEELPRIRLARQNISLHRFSEPQEVVSWMGAIQGQDYNMARWAVGVRLPDPDLDVIRGSINKGEIIRTHVLRPTWHLIPAVDARWMLDLTAPHIHAILRSYHRQRGITTTILKKSAKVIETALAGGNHVTREALVLELARHRIATHEERAAHILLWAELEKLICSGAMQGKKNTYALFDERVPPSKALSREEALSQLARRYFQSRGPATLYDFVNWSNLPVADARKAIGFLPRDFVSATIGSLVYWFKDEGGLPPEGARSVYLLPAYDEYMIGYKDRSACVRDKDKTKVTSINGILGPVIVINGMVTGMWKRTVTGRRTSVELNFFSKRYLSKNKDVRLEVEEAVAKVGMFFGA